MVIRLLRISVLRARSAERATAHGGSAKAATVGWLDRNAGMLGWTMLAIGGLLLFWILAGDYPQI